MAQHCQQQYQPHLWLMPMHCTNPTNKSLCAYISDLIDKKMYACVRAYTSLRAHVFGGGSVHGVAICVWVSCISPHLHLSIRSCEGFVGLKHSPCPDILHPSLLVSGIQRALLWPWWYVRTRCGPEVWGPFSSGYTVKLQFDVAKPLLPKIAFYCVSGRQPQSGSLLMDASPGHDFGLPPCLPRPLVVIRPRQDQPVLHRHRWLDQVEDSRTTTGG